MTSPGYRAYLSAVASLADQAPTLAAHLAEAAALGQADLDAAARKVAEVDDESRKLAQRLSAADEALTRRTHDVGLELVPVAARQAAPGSLVEADRLMSDLQRELIAIDRNCDWVRTHRVARAQAVVQVPTAPRVAPTAVAVTKSAPAANRSRRSSMFVIGGLVLVVLILVVILVVR